ncbi:protein phosphatase 1 regulatory subunit 12A isoform X9 [Drosophila hydei]|uniref:Protein phosphatase 1 regulatory subunit 12B n=1 Tax=Drosophila hydei TaxID=7224 RepID=A0A6J2SZA8_DROHY|nr:protein phosphatase 1 regulatory subunit 12A isoform X9 [Drosophila hydei]
MSSLEVRNNSAMMKRAEQLKRWEESDTNRAAPSPRHEHSRRIKFSSGCVFLAACLSGDKEEVVQLLDQGADINTANVDGLTALHQACIDDKLEMVEFLIEHGADINRQDNEGWTPLHATASCGFVSIACYLVEHNADVAAVNSDGDLALDLAIDVQHMPMINYMEKVVQELNIDVDQARRAEEQAMLKDAKRSDASEVDRPHPKTGATALHVAAAKGYTKVLRLLLAGGSNVDRQDNDGWTPLHAAAHWGQKEAAEMLVESSADMDISNYAGQSCIDVADRKMVKFLEELRANKRNKRRPSSQIRISDAIENHVDKTRTKLVRVEVRTDTAKDAENVKPNQHIHTAEHSGEEEAPWRRKTLRTPNDSPTKNQVPDKDLSGKSANETANDVILRRTQSFENDQKKPIAPVTMLTAATTTTTTTTTLSSPATTVLTPPIRSNPANSSNNNNSNNNNGSSTASASASASDVETPKPKQSAGNIFKNFFKSFVPPVRDEESETQRKAHAKRVRETRRSTQGVTLEEIKSAEELVKKKNMGMNNNNNNNNNSSSFKLEDITSGGTYPPNQSTIIPSAPAVMAAVNLASTAGSQRRISSGPNALNASNQSLNSVGRPVSAPSESINNSAYVTPPVRRYETSTLPATATTTATATATTTATTANNSATSASSANHATATSHEDKDNDKENDNRTQTVIQRRRKPKRRSTGVVHIDMDEIDPERQHETANNDNEDKEKESGSERTSRSRTGSTATASTGSDSKSSSNSDKAENGDAIDYKALWEAARLENDKLKQMLKQKDDEAVQTRATIERFANATTKNSLSEIEKRERRAMERKLSELEEELKLMQKLKTENDRLRAENRALTRVVSKLTTSAQSQLAKSK